MYELLSIESESSRLRQLSATGDETDEADLLKSAYKSTCPKDEEDDDGSYTYINSVCTL